MNSNGLEDSFICSEIQLLTYKMCTIGHMNRSVNLNIQHKGLDILTVGAYHYAAAIVAPEFPVKYFQGRMTQVGKNLIVSRSHS